MKRVTGIGAIFFKAHDLAERRAWYKDHLGIDVQAWGGTTFGWVVDPEGNKVELWQPPDGAWRRLLKSRRRFVMASVAATPSGVQCQYSFLTIRLACAREQRAFSAQNHRPARLR